MRIYWFIIFNVFVVVALSGQNTRGISSADFYEKYALLVDDTSVVIIDGRTLQMYSTGHLKNAICIDADDDNLETLLRENVSRAGTVVVYCTTNRRTTQIVQCLESFYKGDIIFIKDGIRGWKTHELPCIVADSINKPIEGRKGPVSPEFKNR